MIDNRSYTHNLSSCEIKAWIIEIQAWTGFEPMPSAILVKTAIKYSLQNITKTIQTSAKRHQVKTRVHKNIV